MQFKLQIEQLKQGIVNEVMTQIKPHNTLFDIDMMDVSDLEMQRDDINHKMANLKITEIPKNNEQLDVVDQLIDIRQKQFLQNLNR